MTQLSKEHFRGVVWPREEGTDAEGKPTYRYVVIGMLITSEPIEGLRPNETVIDGTMVRHVSEMGMAGALANAPKFEPSRPLGDATDVLLSLGDIVGDPIPAAKPAARRKQ